MLKRFLYGMGKPCISDRKLAEGERAKSYRNPAIYNIAEKIKIAVKVKNK